MTALCVPAEIAGGAGRTTDLSNAIRLAQEFGDRMRHCRGIGWLVYDGKRWAPDQDAAELLAQELPRLVARDARSFETVAAAADGDRLEKLAKEEQDLWKWVRTSASASKLRDSLRLAEPLLSIKIDELDRDPWLLNVQNGTVDLRTGELRQHKPDDFITKITAVPYDPKAEAPTWERFIAWAMKERQELVTYLQRALGYSLTGEVCEQVFFFAFGSGANGKTTALDAVCGVLGEGYVRVAMPDLLVTAQGERHATELAHLRGARMVLCTETEAGRRLSIARVKQLTGETQVTARALYKDPVTFQISAKLWLQSNHRPEIPEQTHATWRRVRVIPFENIPQHVDKKLPKKLHAEQQGILRWLVEGCLDWQRDGLGMPPEVAQAVEEYRQESDVLGSFISECCITGEGASEAAMGLYEAYRTYAQTVGMPLLHAKQFKGEMVSRGFQHRRKSSAVFYEGLALTNGEADA